MPKIIDNQIALYLDIENAGYQKYLPDMILRYGRMLRRGIMTNLQKSNLINFLSDQQGAGKSKIEKIINKHIR